MREEPILRAVFFRTESGREPVWAWLKELHKEDRKTIGEDIKLVQLRWPLGLPRARKLETGLWEIRSRLKGGRIARICFTVQGDETALLHGFVKKSRRMPLRELRLARDRKRRWIEG